METIAYTIGPTTTEVSFTALGVGASPRVMFGTHGASKFTLPLPGVAPETAAVIPFEAPCKIYTGRAWSGSVWTGGAILFQGRRTDNSGNVSGNQVASELVIEDAWYDLRFITFQNTWLEITGGTEASPTTGVVPWPDTVLFQAAPAVTYTPAAVEGHITTGQTLKEILTYAISIGVNLQIGQIDPALYVPFYPIRSMRCADALKICLRAHPDCTTEIDYTTTPPTFHVRQQSSLTALTLPYDGNSTAGGVTRTHLTSQIKPRPDLQVPRVGIYIKTIGAEAGQQVLAIGTDIWPAAAASTLRSFDVSIDMTGTKSGLVTGQVTAYDFDATSLDFWTTHVPALNSATHSEIVPGTLALANTGVNNSTYRCITILDESDNPVDLSVYPNLMGAKGTVHPWMNVLTIEAKITGNLTYQKRKNINPAGTAQWVNIEKPDNHEHTVKVKLTNAPVGTTAYALSTLLATGETYPEWDVVLPSLAPVAAGTAGASLMTPAKYIYLSLANLQYQFKHTILEQPFSTIVKPGKHALNVTGGASAWTSMAAMIQEVTIDLINSPATGLTSGRTTVSCGPVEHLEPGQLVQLLNIFTNRNIAQINPGERSSGLPGGGLNAAMPSDTAKENSIPATPDAGQQMFTAADSVTGANINGIQHDPANGQINVLTYQPTSGTPVGSGLLAPCYFGAGVPSSSTLPASVNFRLNWRYVDTSGNAEYYCSTAGNNSTSVWTQLSGGTGGGGAVWI